MTEPDKIPRPLVHVMRFGSIERDLLNWVTSALCEFYGRVRLSCNEVHILFFEDRITMEAYLKREGERFAIEHGFEYVPTALGFSSMHYAWSGRPTIVVCNETIKERDKTVVLGELRHEAGHSILHGSPKFYTIRPPETYEKLIIRNRLNKRIANMAFYLFSVGVKDFEVTRLLVRNGYINCQKALHRWSLRISDDEKKVSRLAQSDHNVAFLLMANTLKPVMGSVPLLNTEAKSDILPLIEENLTLLTRQSHVLARRIVEEWVPSLGDETLDNIGMLIENVVAHETTGA